MADMDKLLKEIEHELVDVDAQLKQVTLNQNKENDKTNAVLLQLLEEQKITQKMIGNLARMVHQLSK